MTTINQAREAVYERWRVQWGVTTAYAFENENFSAPVTGPRVRLSVQHRPLIEATLGAPTFRRHTRHARVFIQVYVPPDQGMQQLDSLAQQARAVFESMSFSGLNFFPALVRESPDEGSLKVCVIDAPFRYQETK